MPGKMQQPGKPDALLAIGQHEWAILAEAYDADWPRGIYAKYILQNCISWNKRNPNFPLMVYRPAAAETPDRYATFVIFSYMGNYPNLNFFTLEPGAHQLSQALCQTQLIPWKRVLVCGVHDHHRHVLDDLIRVRQLRVRYELLSGYHWISRKDADEWTIEVPPEVCIKDLKVEDAELVNSLWPHSYPGSDRLLRELIDYNGGIGLFFKETGQICGWIMKNQFLGLGILQILPEFQGRGYAKLITKAMSKRMSAEGLDLHACIMRNNRQSLSLFKGLGFQFVDKQCWLEIEEVKSIECES